MRTAEEVKLYIESICGKCSRIVEEDVEQIKNV